MTPFQIAMMIVRGISTLSVNPLLGGGGIGAQKTAALLDMLATLMEGGSEMKKELDVFAEEIKALVAANGNPSRGQWESMQARDAAARQALIDNAASLASAPAPKGKSK